MMANGAGRQRAASAVAAARSRVAPGAVVSTGFCGALDPSYRIGDVFVAESLRMDEERVPVQAPQTSRPYAHGVLVSVDRVIATVEEKQALRAAGAAAVEMEAAGVLPLVREWGLPLYCIRTVTDRAEEGFLLDLNAARLPDGHISTLRLVASALKRPAMLIPELVRLRNNSAAAAESLGDFLADCRF